jgi:hypothetical protein
MRRFDLADRWAYRDRYRDGQVYGMGASRLRDLFASADWVINLHGGTEPVQEHYSTGRLVYLETDPVELQIELSQEKERTVRFLEPHCAFFTFGENYGRPGCLLPVADRFAFKPTRQPVVMDFWQRDDLTSEARPPEPWTTIGNWKQPDRQVHFNGEVYHWSKHFEFMKFIDLPQRTKQTFELALSSYEQSDRDMLEDRGWRVRHALEFSNDPEPYRGYIQGSRGEFTVAKDQNIRLRSGWFSDRSATYLAAGRPVITQETGFSGLLPTGRGLFAFTGMQDVLAALEAVNADYPGHCRAAAEVARECFNYDVVLKRMMADLGE